MKIDGWGRRQAVRDFFTTNPDEELSYADLMVKFDVTADVARQCVKDLKREGVIESVHVIRLAAKGRM